MNSDAARFKHYKRTGNFLPVTAYTGIDSVKAVLSEDITYPISKAELKAKQGWKVVDLTPDRRVHLSGLLAKLPEKTYSSLDEVIKELRAAF